MQIECPSCKASGTMNDHDIPDEGINLCCPRCKENFRVAKPRKKMTSVFATNTCPSCGYSTFCEEVFDECPHCGVEVKSIVERRREQEVRKREQESFNGACRTDAAIAAVPVIVSKIKVSAPVEEKTKINLATFADGFDPVAAVGWGVAACAISILALGGWGLIYYLGTDIQAQLSEKSIEPVTAWHVFWGYGFLPWIEAFFGFALLVAALGFLQRNSWGMQGMLRVISVSLVLVPTYELAQYGIWIVKSIAPPWWAYLVELTSATLFSMLLMVPLFFLLRYLQGNNFRRSYLKN